MKMKEIDIVVEALCMSDYSVNAIGIRSLDKNELTLLLSIIRYSRAEEISEKRTCQNYNSRCNCWNPDIKQIERQRHKKKNKEGVYLGG